MARRQRRAPTIAPRKSGVGLLFHEELLAAIRARLLSGRVVVHAPTESLTRLENEVYTPGTNANAGYEVFLGMGNGKILPITLIQKTPALRRFLEKAGNPREEFEDLVLLGLGPVFEKHQVPCMLTRLRGTSLEMWVDRVLASIDLTIGGGS